MQERRAHWVRHNQQERIPSRMIAFDTESRSTREGDKEIQEWRIGCAIRWRNDTKATDHAEGGVFDNPRQLWTWVSSFCRPGVRTVVWCHNLGYDVRISQVFTILPTLGFHLEWCNLDRNVSSMTWRSDHGTLVFADTWTWIPLPLEHVAPQVGLVKFKMPPTAHNDSEWQRYCMRDAEIVYHVVSRLVRYIKNAGLGNWQPTGAGMSLATWRHKFLNHKILVHDDAECIKAERAAMYTGRAEAWKHGQIYGERWTEVDLRTAYLTIARECELPRKLHMSTGAITLAQYGQLRKKFAVLCRCSVRTDVPVLPYRSDNGILWPVGEFDGWYWDTEVDCALRYGANIRIHETYVYVQDPILADWAQWVMSVLDKNNTSTDPLIQTWIKHCSRALIGRLALRTPSWEVFGTNPEGITGITHVTMPDDGTTTRLLHVGGDTLIETHRMEGKDSLPQVTGKIMAECRVHLWEGMNIAGLENIAHVDTDSILANSNGLQRIRNAYGDDFTRLWSIKGTYRQLEMFGPRAYRRDGARVAAGIPGKAVERPDGSIEGKRWASLSKDLNDAKGGVVTIHGATWHMKRSDPRRRDAPGVAGATMPYSVGVSSLMSSSDSALIADG